MPGLATFPSFSHFSPTLTNVELRQDEMQTPARMAQFVQQLHLSDTIYDIYGRMRRGEQLSRQERQIIQEL